MSKFEILKKISNLSSRIEKIIRKATEIDPKKRYKSVQELKDSLEKISSINYIQVPNISSNANFTIQKDSIILYDINCVGADGNIFEHYDELLVNKQHEYLGNSNKIWLSTAYHIAPKDFFVPSLALTCNILASLFKFNKSRRNSSLVNLLQEYNGFNAKNGLKYHNQNTVINWAARKIVHNSNIYNRSISETRFDFDPDDFSNFALPQSNADYIRVEQALKNNVFEEFMKNLTGLENPIDFIHLVNFFRKQAILWIPKRPHQILSKGITPIGSADFNNFDIGLTDQMDFQFLIRYVKTTI